MGKQPLQWQQVRRVMTMVGDVVCAEAVHWRCPACGAMFVEDGAGCDYNAGGVECGACGFRPALARVGQDDPVRVRMVHRQVDWTQMPFAESVKRLVQEEGQVISTMLDHEIEQVRRVLDVMYLRVNKIRHVLNQLPDDLHMRMKPLLDQLDKIEDPEDDEGRGPAARLGMVGE